MIAPYRLWSLWEMLRFYADKFVKLTSLLRGMSLVLKSYPNSFQEKHRDDIAARLRDALGLLEDIGLNQAAKKARTISKHTNSDGYNAEHYSVSLNELNDRIRDELEDRYCLLLSANEAGLFESVEPLFGIEVEHKFPSASYEIDEAGKCIALGRSTASVFHLMRVMEIGVEAIRQCLGVPDPIKDAEKNWGVILRKVKDAMSGKTSWSADDKQLFDEAYASLDAVRVAWRNATMHVENKYNREEAEHIFAVVKGFMKKIASRMDEGGEPLA